MACPTTAFQSWTSSGILTVVTVGRRAEGSDTNSSRPISSRPVKEGTKLRSQKSYFSKNKHGLSAPPRKKIKRLCQS